MLRLAERVMGEGELFRAGAALRTVPYELSCYREYAVEGSDLTSLGDLIEGHLHASPDDLEPLVGTSHVLTLHLDDGRRCDLYVVNTDGVVTSADRRGFHRDR
jgi:hypothetical protein